jgi:hypothetical protein
MRCRTLAAQHLRWGLVPYVKAGRDRSVRPSASEVEAGSRPGRCSQALESWVTPRAKILPMNDQPLNRLSRRHPPQKGAFWWERHKF